MDFEVVYLADFTLSSEAIIRIVEEVRLNHLLGYRTGLVHLGPPDVAVRPDILELIDCRLAHSLNYFDPHSAKLVIAADPEAICRVRPKLPLRLNAGRVLAILEGPKRADQLQVMHARLVQRLGDIVQWTATTYDSLADLRRADLPTLGTVWESFGRITPAPERTRRAGELVPVVGTAAGRGTEHWPGDEVVRANLWHSAKYRISVIGDPPPSPLQRDWQIQADGGRQHGRFLERLDAFVYFPDTRPATMPLTAIGACLGAGVPVLLPPHLAPAVGKGPRYVRQVEAPAALARELSGQHSGGSTAFDPVETHRRRMSYWIGAPTLRAQPRQRRAMLFASNGDGLGHVSRLIGVARKLPHDIAPTFVTLSSAIGVVEDAGFPVEMILSHRYANLDPNLAYPWMAAELREILARHQPDVFVFDGGNPYNFMTEVVAARRGPRYLWLRRGLWQARQDNRLVIDKGKYFDCIIEPRDLAASMDRGATAANSTGVVVTNPIRMLDDEQQLSRDAAREKLGLDPDRPAVLVQLGVGNARDVTLAFKAVIAALQTYRDVQVVSLIPPISHRPVRSVEGVRNLAVYPVAPYLRAFDFAISAAGYNSFHELLGACIPTIFAVTMRPELDDQMARANFAASIGCALALDTDDLSAIPGLIDTMLKPRRRQEMRSNARRVATPNGAVEAAQLVAEFAR